MGNIRTGEKAVTRYRLGETTPSAVYRGTERLWPGQDTELLIEATANQYVSISSLSAGAVVDFGDGCALPTVLGLTGYGASHTYAAPGTYRVRVTYPDGGLHVLGASSLPVTSRKLLGLRLGSDVSSIGANAFWDALGEGKNILVVTVPPPIVKLGQWAFMDANVVLAEIAAQEIDSGIFSGCPDLRRVWLRESVAEMVPDEGQGPFYRATPGAVIYCEADEKPAGWPAGWNEIDGAGTALTVVWGQKTRPW